MLRELIERCLAKDRSAFDEFVRRFQSLVTYVVKLRLKKCKVPFNLEDVKDIVQGVFLDIWEKNKLEQLKDRAKLDSWIAIVSQNAALDYIRSHRHIASRISPIVNPDEQDLSAVDIIPSSTDPLEEIKMNELSLILNELIDSLSPRDRLVINLNLLHNKTAKEIAHILKVSINTVSTIIRRTKLKLRKELEKKGY